MAKRVPTKSKAEHKAELDVEVAKASEALAEARRLLDAESSNTVKVLLKHRDGKNADRSLTAARHLSKLQGLEVVKHEHTGTLAITDTHAKAILEAVGGQDDEQ